MTPSDIGGSEKLLLTPPTDRLTHYLFRYPAKFHPPVARTLLDTFTGPTDTVLDPFCGSGTLLVEALATGRPSIGIDVDPVAALVSRAKTHRYNVAHLRQSALTLTTRLSSLERPADEYARRDKAANDLSPTDFATAAAPLDRWIPAIPNLTHWFRRYVLIDLARMRLAIETLEVPTTHRDLFLVVFASIIRNSSNADPVPVSGLEVTSHMLRREEAGRFINPFAQLRKALSKTIDAHDALTTHTSAGVPVHVIQGDATDLQQHLKRHVDAVVTSPPYHGAVDYYRRHQLEMYWMGATTSHSDRLQLLRKYVGRTGVPRSHPFVRDGVLSSALAKDWEARIREVNPKRADAFRHYLVAMTRFFKGLATRIGRGAPVILVLGHSNWSGSEIPTTELFTEIAHDDYKLEKTLYYPVTNRYMSYSRHNGADIDTEYVLALKRR